MQADRAEPLTGKSLDIACARAMGWTLGRFAGMFDLQPPKPSKSRALFREEAAAWELRPPDPAQPPSAVVWFGYGETAQIAVARALVQAAGGSDQ